MEDLYGFVYLEFMEMLELAVDCGVGDEVLACKLSVWARAQCSLMAPCCRCPVRRLDSVVVVIPMYLALARSSHTPLGHLYS